MALRLQPLPPVEVPRGHLLFSSSSLPPPPHHPCPFRSLPAKLLLPLQLRHRRSCLTLVSVGKEEVQVSEDEGKELQQEQEASPDDLEYIGQINRVLELLKRNRNMAFGEVGEVTGSVLTKFGRKWLDSKTWVTVKLTIMIEDPREVERKRLLGVDPDEVTRDDLVSALEDVNEGRIPENRLALRLLSEELLQWPNLEVEAIKKRPGKSLYARATDTGVDPREAAKRLNMDWDSAADIEPEDEREEEVPVPVPAAVGYGALYLVTAFPLIIGVAVVLILFYNSLQ